MENAGVENTGAITYGKPSNRKLNSAQEGTTEYLAIPKGRGFVYAYENQVAQNI